MARFLVIDDDNSIRFMMVATLEGAGHEVIAAANGTEGAALFRAQPADAVVTDIMLPDDTISAVLELRDEYPSVPFIVISGLSSHSARGLEVAQALGAFRVLPKPFRLADFLGATDEVLAAHNIPLPKPGKKR